MPLIRRTPRPHHEPGDWVQHPIYGLCSVNAIAYAKGSKPTTMHSLIDLDGVRHFSAGEHLAKADAPAVRLIRRTKP